MAMDLKTISKWLDEDDTKHQLIEEKDLIVFGAKGDIQTGHFIRLKEGGEMLNYQVQIRVDEENLEVPPDHQHIQLLLKYLLYQNYQIKFGCWEYDYNDGDIRFSVEIPLEEDGVITQKQFKRISGLMFGNVDTMGKEILELLETGEFPSEDDDTEDKLRKLLLGALSGDEDIRKLLSSESSNDKKDKYGDDDGI